MKHDKAALGKCWSRVTGSVFTMREAHDAASAAILDAEEKVRALEAKLAEAEAERDLLAAECRAWRDAYDNNDCDGESGHCRCEGAPDSVLAATDAAGVLEPRSGDIVLGEGK